VMTDVRLSLQMNTVSGKCSMNLNRQAFWQCIPKV